MSLPALTPQQRTEALQKALHVRQERAEIRRRLKRGAITLTQVITDAETNDMIAKMPVSSLLTAVPGIGKVRAAQIMQQIGIASNRSIRGLGANQKAALEQEFDTV